MKSWDLSENGVDSWDEEFIDIKPIESLVDLTVCADFLGIKELVFLGCAKIAAIVGHQNQLKSTADSSARVADLSNDGLFN